MVLTNRSWYSTEGTILGKVEPRSFLFPEYFCLLLLFVEFSLCHYLTDSLFTGETHVFRARLLVYILDLSCHLDSHSSSLSVVVFVGFVVSLTMNINVDKYST